MPDGSFNPNPELEITEAAPSSEAPKDSRDASTIGFPYTDLKVAIEAARTILKAGAVPLSRDQLAGALGQQAGSGNFSIKVGAARMFGLAETVAGKYQLTRLGFDILDANETRVKVAMAKAFLNVPLYKRTYDEFRNGQLPPRPHGLENAFASFGVARKQTDKARRAFENSARLAGFFDHGNDKLVEPVLGPIGDRPATMSAETATPPPPSPPHSAVTMPEATEHPFIKGLLLSLPKLGDQWDADGRMKWLKTAADAFDLMYQGSGPITILPPKGITYTKRIKPITNPNE